jgi:hypothetical protein
MIELVFTVCLISSPDTCRERAHQLFNLTPVACMMKASPYLARWAGEHPGWMVTRWRCRTPGAGGREI